MAEIPKGVLVGLCNPLLDILANVDEDFLKKYGLKSNDAILAGDDHKGLVQDIVEHFKVDYVAGGSAQNTLRIAQWIINKPGNFIFMGCVGKDENGQILKKKANEAGIEAVYQYDPNTPTGTCAVLVSNNNQCRSLVADLAAANCFTIDHIKKPEQAEIIENAKYFYISGFFLTVSLETALTLAKRAAEKNLTLMMNLSAPFIVQLFKDNMLACVPYIDILFGNDMEAKAFAESLGFKTTDPREIALQLSQLEKVGSKKRLVVITQGDQPVLLAQDGVVKEYPVEALKPEEIVDTNGAGDAFVGGFIAQLVQGRDLDACVKCGIWAARHIIKQSGCAYDPKEVYRA